MSTRINEGILDAGNFDRGNPLQGLTRTIANILPGAAWQIKQPDGIDIYWGEYPVDIAAANPYLVIAKASGAYTNGGSGEDPKVDDYIEQARDVGAKTAVYHYLRPNNITPQAELFMRVWDRIKGTNSRPILDVQVDPRSAGVGFAEWAYQVKYWCDFVEQRAGGRPLIYSSVFFWYFTSEPDWAIEYDCWPAWYPYHPDEFATIPDKYILPKFGRWAMWQYAQDGRSQGYKANDYNLLADWYVKELDGNAPTPEPEPEPEPIPEVWKGTVRDGEGPLGVFPKKGFSTGNIFDILYEKDIITGTLKRKRNGVTWMELQTSKGIDAVGNVPVRKDGEWNHVRIEAIAPPDPMPEPLDILTVKKWGQDSIMLGYDYDTSGMKSGNFQVVTMLIPDRDEGGEKPPFYQADQVHLRLRIPHGDVMKLYLIQPTDTNWKGDLQTPKMKMNWLCQYRSRPYLQEKDAPAWEWPVAPYILWGEMVYGGQKVLAKGYKSVFGEYRGTRGTFDCAVISCLRKTDWDSGVITHATHPYWIQKATAANKGPSENTYTDTPKGVIYAPLWDPRDWYFTGLASYQPKEFLLPMDVVNKI